MKGRNGLRDPFHNNQTRTSNHLCYKALVRLLPKAAKTPARAAKVSCRPASVRKALKEGGQGAPSRARGGQGHGLTQLRAAVPGCGPGASGRVDPDDE